MKKKNNFFKTIALLLVLPIVLMFVGCLPKTANNTAEQSENQQQEQQQDNQGEQGGGEEDDSAVEEASYQALKSVLEDTVDYSGDYIIISTMEDVMYMTSEPVAEEEEEAQEVTLEEEESENESDEEEVVLVPMMSDYGKIITHIDMANGQMAEFKYGYNEETEDYNEDPDDISYVMKMGEGNDAVWVYLGEYEGTKFASKYSPDHVAHEYGIASQMVEVLDFMQGDTVDEFLSGIQDSKVMDLILGQVLKMLPKGVNLAFDFDVYVETEDDITSFILIVNISLDTTAVQMAGEEEEDIALPAMQFDCHFEMAINFTAENITSHYAYIQIEAVSYFEVEEVIYKSTILMETKELTELTYQAFDTTLLPDAEEIEEYGEVRSGTYCIRAYVDGQEAYITNSSYEWDEDLNQYVEIFADELVLADLDLNDYEIEIDEDKVEFDGWYLDEACTIPLQAETIDFKSYSQYIYAKRVPKDGYAVVAYKFFDVDNGWIRDVVVDVVDVNGENSLPSEEVINEIINKYSSDNYIFAGFVDAEGNEITSFEEIGVENQGYYVIYANLTENISEE